MKDARIIGVIGLLILFFFGKNYLFPSDIVQIKNTLKKISNSVSTIKERPPVARLMHLKKLKEVFKDRIELTYNFDNQKIYKLYKADSLVEKSLSLQKYLQKIEIEFLDLNINVKNLLATVRCTFTIKGKKISNEEFYEASQVVFTLEKINGKWLVNSLTNVDILDDL